MSLPNRRRVLIGDVHGCLDELLDLEREAGLSSHDDIVLVGDCLNKGPDSLGVLDWIDRLGARCVLGNHEAKLLQILRTDASDRSEKEQRFLSQFRGFHVEAGLRVENWPLWIEWTDLLCVHAGLEPGCDHPSAMRRKCLLSIRTWDGKGDNLDVPGDPAWFDCITWPVPVVFGHWAMHGLIDRPDVKGLDTGCVYGGRLTAWSPDEKRFWHIPARRAWKTP